MDLHVRPCPSPRLGSQVLQTGASILFGTPRTSKSDLSERSRPSLSFLPASGWMVNPSAMAYRFSCCQLAHGMVLIEDGRSISRSSGRLSSSFRSERGGHCGCRVIVDIE